MNEDRSGMDLDDGLKPPVDRVRRTRRKATGSATGANTGSGAPPAVEEEEDRETGENAPPLPISDFVAFSPDHNYVYLPDGAVWSATAVNARVLPIERGPDSQGKPGKPLAASKWLDRNDAVVGRTWAPGEPQIIKDRMADEGGFFAKKGARVLNLYRPPQIVRVTDDDVGFWQSHLHDLWPDEADHIEQWFAHRVQHPGKKINHGLLLTGEQGIGKDAVIEPLKRAIGGWNFKEISPEALLGSFNEYVQSVALRISEIKDLGDIDRFAFYEVTKTLMAAPPDTLRCNPKYVKPYHVMNVTGVIMTSNYKVSGLYLPRRLARQRLPAQGPDRPRGFRCDCEGWRRMTVRGRWGRWGRFLTRYQSAALQTGKGGRPHTFTTGGRSTPSTPTAPKRGVGRR
jgi:hypothetical protein